MMYLLFLIWLANFMLAIFVLTKNNRSLVNQLFAVLIFSILTWSISNYLVDEVSTKNVALFFTKLTFFGAILIPSALLTFSMQFTGKKISFNKIYIFIPPIIMCLLLVGDNIVQDIDFTQEPVKVVYNIGYYFFAGYSLVYLVGSLLLLVYQYLHSTSINKRKLSYFLVGLTISVFFALLTNLILPILGFVNMVALGPAGTVVFFSFTANSITKYRLFDIRIFLRRIFVIGSALTSSLIIPLVLFNINKNLLNSLIPNWLILPLVLALAIISFGYFQGAFLKFANKYFFTTLYDAKIVMEQLVTEIRRTIELNEVIKIIASTITKIMGVEAYIFAQCEQKNLKCFASNTGVQNTKEIGGLFNENFFISYLQQSGEVFVTEENERFLQEEELHPKHTTPKVRSGLKSALIELKKDNISVAIPMVSKGELVSVLFLGPKLTKDAFTVQDIHLLETIASQAAVAIQNAMLYAEAKEFNVKLQKEIEKATAELRVANKKLKELDQAKSEFMSIASHQLRTPLAGIMGYLSMITDGDYGKVSKEQGPIIHDVLEATKRLIRMVNIFLNVTRIEAGRFVMNYTTVPFHDVLESVYKELKPTADVKKVTLTYNKKTLPQVEVDADKIKDVVLNLVDNAIKYSPQGSVTLDAESKGKTVHFWVKDTGVGIVKGEAENLFEKFVRGSGIARVEPNGSGLGLFIAKKIAESHGGRIWAESEGEGRGSTFNVEIPIKADSKAKKAAEEFKQRAKKGAE